MTRKKLDKTIEKCNVGIEVNLMKLDRVSKQSNLKLEKAYQLQIAQCCLVELSLHVDALFVDLG